MTRVKHVPLSPGALMRAVDSPAGSDPMPVAHHEFPMKYPELIDNSVTEFMSLIYSKTIRKGHRSPRAVDGVGKVFTIENVAEDRGWSLDWAQRVFHSAIERGLVKRGEGGKGNFSPASICLCGRAKPLISKDKTPVGNPQDPECTLRKVLSESEYAQYEKLPEEIRRKFAEEELAGAKEDKRIIADTIWSARQFVNQRHDTRLSQFGIQPDAHPAARRSEQPIVELRFIGEEVEGEAKERSVHSATAEGVNGPPNRSAPSGVSLFGFPSGLYPSIEESVSQSVNGKHVGIPEKTDRPDGPKSNPLSPILDAFEAIGQQPSDHEVGELISACKTAVPDIENWEIAAAVIERGSRLSSSIARPVRFLVRSDVPRHVASQSFARWRKKVRATKPEYEPVAELPPDDPVEERRQCKKCGGWIIRYASGFIAPCPCEAGRRSGATGA